MMSHIYLFLPLVPLNTSGLHITTSGDPTEGCQCGYSATCSISVTAGVGATFNHTLIWTYANGSKVVNASNVAVTEEAHGDSLAVTVTFQPLLAMHVGTYQCLVTFSSNGPTTFDSKANLNITMRAQSKTRVGCLLWF